MSHVAYAVVQARARRESVFTLPELVQLLDQAVASEPTERISEAHAARMSAFPLVDPVIDPIGRPRSVHDSVTRRVAALCAEMLDGAFID